MLGEQGGPQSGHQAELVGEHGQAEAGIVLGGELDKLCVGETPRLTDGVHVEEVTRRRPAAEGANLVRDRVGEREATNTRPSQPGRSAEVATD